MKTIHDLRAPPGVIGRVERIIVRGDPRQAARSIAVTRAWAGIGLADDRLGQHGAAELSTRQVTLIQCEHLPVIAQLARVGARTGTALLLSRDASGAAQQAAVVLGSLRGLAACSGDVPAPAGGLRLAAIGAFKFPGAAVPGQLLDVSARVAGRVFGLIKIEGEVTADGADGGAPPTGGCRSSSRKRFITAATGRACSAACTGRPTAAGSHIPSRLRT